DGGGDEDHAIDIGFAVGGERGQHHGAAHAFAEHDYGNVRMVRAHHFDDIVEIAAQRIAAGPYAGIGGAAEAALIVGDDADAVIGESGGGDRESVGIIAHAVKRDDDRL